MDSITRYKAYVTGYGDHWVNVGKLEQIGGQWFVMCHGVLNADLSSWRSTESEARRDAADEMDRMSDRIRRDAAELRAKYQST